MAPTNRLRDVVVTAREELASSREKAKLQHVAGSPGIQVCLRLTDAIDQAVSAVYEAALADQSDDPDFAASFALVPHGGYGRRDQAPFSDVDLMLLRHASVPDAQVEPFSRRLVADLSDLGLDLGFSLRKPREAIQLAKRDPIILTSLAESRFLAGGLRLFTNYLETFRRYATHHALALIPKMERARSEERHRYGETVFLLEPNVKRSRGCLRDIQLLRWIGFVRYGEPNPSGLRLLDALGPSDGRKIRRASEFLLRLRNELHFHADKSTDILSRGEQMRIADAFGYRGTDGGLPVESFMQEYFEHTQNVRDIVGHFEAQSMQRPWVQAFFGPLVTSRINGDFRVGVRHIGATQKGLQRLKGNLVEILRLMELANQMDKRIEHRTWDAIRDDMEHHPTVNVTPEAAARFMSMMNYTSRLGSVLRRLHEVRVLEKLIAGMDRARCLLQFNRYHKYTVDEHSFQAVERATEFQNLDSSLGRAYRGVKQRNLLHLALLIHDLGKGFKGDHCQVGRDLAEQTAQRLGLSNDDSERLQFLVEKHLLMSHLAFRRDTSDQATIIDFAKEVGSAERLRMLFVLTAADLASVGPDVLNLWKVDVLIDLYRTTRNHLSGGGPTRNTEWDAESIRDSLRSELEGDAWNRRQIDSLTPSYLRECSRETILEDFRRLRELEPNSAIAWGKYLPDRDVLEFAIGIRRQSTKGLFHQLAGALTSHRLKILSAQIHTFANDLVLDRFQVVDPDFSGETPEARLRDISRAMMDAIDPVIASIPVFNRVWKESSSRLNDALEVLPTRVSIDNSTSADFTILDVFTHDRDGILYEITRALYELRVSVRYAKIGTYLDQVVDVFYLSEEDDSKIFDEVRLAEIRDGVVQAIARHRQT